MSRKTHPYVKRGSSSGVHPHAAQPAVTPAAIRFLIGIPVCAVLADGSVYCGTISGVENDELILQGFRSTRKVSRNPAQAKAQIAALGGLGSLFGGAAPAAAAPAPAAAAPAAPGGLGPAVAPGGLGGMLGGLFGGGGGLGNWFRIGLGVMRFIFPLLKGFGV